ncbi:MAG: 2,3-bisphosphoglycerate-independent phosphoglycerate mutase [Patescibacteria group bacterium]|jgi:2,3-bisphosphoglycerate-independent phosphoglycerate mutase
MFENNLFKRSKNNGFKKSPLVLIVLDGWGIAPSWGGNAITLSSTPVFDGLLREYPSTALQASGLAVGLPDGAPGNSEAGHLNIGAGRIVHQDISLIDSAIENGDFFKNDILRETYEHAEKNESNIHIMGLLSDVGTHSHIRHLDALLKYFKDKNFNRIYIHLFSDGRDSDPMYGIELIGKVNKIIEGAGIGRIESIMGRFYAMDRDNRWGRTARAYNCFVRSEAESVENANEVFSRSYAAGTTDEFIEPRIINNKNFHFVPIRDNDSIIIFNFRYDRVNQLIDCFVKDSIDRFPDHRKLQNLFVSSFANSSDMTKFKTIIQAPKIENPIAKVLSENGLKQLHIAETEKFPHVTYFFNGGIDEANKNEDRLRIPSPKVRTYDLKPEMSADKVLKSVLSALNKNIYDFYVVNFANPDMVGHTGNLKATMHAVSFVDQCLGQIILSIQSKNGTAVICADHGNAEQMVNPQTGDPDTEHTTNPVPFIVVSDNLKDKISLNSNGSLSNIAPSILDLLNIDVPNEMKTKESLIIKREMI